MTYYKVLAEYPAHDSKALEKVKEIADDIGKNVIKQASHNSVHIYFEWRSDASAFCRKFVYGFKFKLIGPESMSQRNVEKDSLKEIKASNRGRQPSSEWSNPVSASILGDISDIAGHIGSSFSSDSSSSDSFSGGGGDSGGGGASGSWD